MMVTNGVLKSVRTARRTESVCICGRSYPPLDENRWLKLQAAGTTT